MMPPKKAAPSTAATYARKNHPGDMSWDEFMAKPEPAPPEKPAPPREAPSYAEQVSLRVAERARRRRG